MYKYNKIMLYFYLFSSIAMLLVVTGMCIKDGFRHWGFYYILVAITFMMYLMRKYMMKRMDKHMEYLENEHKKSQQ